MIGDKKADGPAGKPVTRYGASGERSSFYIADPEGNMVELRAG